MSLNRSKNRQNDPTGQASRRRKATRSLNVRLTRAESEIKSLIRGLSTTRRTVTPLVNQPTVIFDYDLTPAELAQIEAQIRAIINDELGTEGDIPPPGWFWAGQIEPPYRQGTMEEVNRFNQLITAAIVAALIVDPFVTAIPIEQVIQSREYQEALRSITVENYSTIKSLSDRTAAQVIQEMNSGIRSGLSRNEINKNISERFDVSRSNAKRIADTEINRAYNDAKLNSGKIMQQRTGQRMGVLHISALLPETREAHADRHGNAYTIEDQSRWWDSGVNRINCKCSTSTVLIDNQGNVIQTEDQSTLEQERKFFEQERFEFEN